MTPHRPTLPDSLGRLWRLTRKELSEVLRDRRTIVTLVAMPLLLYPLLSVAFLQFAWLGKADSERNHIFIRKQLHAQSVIPAKRGRKTWCIHGVRAQMRAAFPSHKYCRR